MFTYSGYVVHAKFKCKFFDSYIVSDPIAIPSTLGYGYRVKDVGEWINVYPM